MSHLCRRLLLVLALLTWSIAASAQTVVVHKNAILREHASTKSKALAHLKSGDELSLVTTTRQNKFWHVTTADGKDGWIYTTLVHFEDEDEEEDAEEPEVEPPAAAIKAVSDEIDEDWAKPAPSGPTLQGPPGLGTCAPSGESGGDTYTNRRKNRTDVPSSYHPVSFDAMFKLPDYWDEQTRKHVVTVTRSKWTAKEHALTKPFEGVAVSLIGYINRVKRQDGGKGESTNCHFTGDNRFVDVHVALVEDYDDEEKEAIVVEPTPRFYSKHPAWVWDRLIKLEGIKNPVRISGWTLYDPQHGGHMGKYRKSMWEIHPITKIEIFRDGKWVEY